MDVKTISLSFSTGILALCLACSLVYDNHLRNKLKSKNKDYSELLTVYDTVRRGKLDLESKFKGLEEEKINLASKYEESERKKLELESKLESLKKEKLEFKSKCRDSEKGKPELKLNYEELEKERFELQSILKNLEQENLELKTKYQGLEKMNLDLQSRCKGLEDERMKECSKGDREKLKWFREEKEKLDKVKKDMADLEKISYELKIKNSELSSRNSKLVSTVDSLNKEKEQIFGEIKKYLKFKGRGDRGDYLRKYLAKVVGEYYNEEFSIESILSPCSSELQTGDLNINESEIEELTKSTVKVSQGLESKVDYYADVQKWKEDYDMIFGEVIVNLFMKMVADCFHYELLGGLKVPKTEKAKLEEIKKCFDTYDAVRIVLGRDNVCLSMKKACKNEAKLEEQAKELVDILSKSKRKPAISGDKKKRYEQYKRIADCMETILSFISKD